MFVFVCADRLQDHWKQRCQFSTVSMGRQILTGHLPSSIYGRFLLCSRPPPPRGVRGGHFPKEIGGFGPIPAQIRGTSLFLIFILVLRAAGFCFEPKRLLFDQIVSLGEGKRGVAFRSRRLRGALPCVIVG
jgi:hypothetical protein